METTALFTSPVGASNNSTTTVQLDRPMLDAVLKPYKKHCRYLRAATAERAETGADRFSAFGVFAIPESCYIANTGHFNAVEFNICYNQLTYFLLAACIERGWIEAFHTWDLTRFHRQQLSNFLIVRFSSAFLRPMRSDAFEGRVAIGKISSRSGAIFMRTTCAFTDQFGGRAEGHALIAALQER